MTRSNLSIAIVCTTLGVIGGVGVMRFSEDDLHPVRQDSGEYTYINPLIECEVERGVRTQELSFIENDVAEKVEEIKRNNNLTSTAVYFRDLRNGPWLGIDEDVDFAPASLVKVPIFMTLLKMSEGSLGLLDMRVTILLEGEQQMIQNIKPKDFATPGKEYSVRELMELMIVHSDNTAMMALRSFVSEDDLKKTFAQVGVPFTVQDDDLRLSVKQYAAFFRILYNASYLNRENSEYALGVLSHLAYDQGLRGSIPERINIAHKFGERSDLGVDGTNQLHDCGIVYYPGSPYLLCVMTRGDNITSMQNAIQEISNTVYKDVSNSYAWGE